MVPAEITFYSNKAAALIELRKYEDCIRCCDFGINIISNHQNGSCDLAKLAKIKTRKATALTKMGRYAESVKVYESAL